ncbi:MAG TPA: tRNA pseudouridine(38-40) synthase TruA [Dehalococcoidia bacterium]|nr:tRNA pseudouridine(38-40) synthase TruA [Dehalococcoidia bacterium]
MLIEYDGTQYYGFQWQAGLPTIQNELEQAIRRFCGQSSRVIAASRTDTGVHAKGQVVSFWAKRTLDTMTLVRALNYHLPEDIAVKAAYRASDDFSVRGDAVSREYCYYILNSHARSPFSRRFALFVPKMLDMQAMSEACHLMKGEHDFASFASSLDVSKSTLRNVYEAGVEKRGDFTVFRIVANSFLPHQVRSTVGLLIRLGLGKIGITHFRDIMDARSVGLAGPLSPACGLCLEKVNYPRPLGS